MHTKVFYTPFPCYVFLSHHYLSLGKSSRRHVFLVKKIASDLVLLVVSFQCVQYLAYTSNAMFKRLMIVLGFFAEDEIAKSSA